MTNGLETRKAAAASPAPRKARRRIPILDLLINMKSSREKSRSPRGANADASYSIWIVDLLVNRTPNGSRRSMVLQDRLSIITIRWSREVSPPELN
jgi:hypothetical protein